MQDVNNFQKMPFGRGQAFKCRGQMDGEKRFYIIGSVGSRMVGLVNLKTGKRWGDPLEVNDAEELIPEEATELFKGLEIVAGLTVTTEETSEKPVPVPEPSRTFKVGQLLRCQHPGKERETIVQIAYSDVPGSTVRLVTVNGQYPGRLCGDPVTVQDVMEITQAEFNQMNPHLEPIEEVKPTFEAA